MATLVVPTEYKTIQEAVDHAIAGDEIRVLAGNYPENVLVKTDNITIIGSAEVFLDGSKIGGIAFQLLANHVTLIGTLINNYPTAVLVKGNNNTCRYVLANSNLKAFNSIGNYNVFRDCVAQSNGLIGLDLQGNYNQVIACRISYNLRGIVAVTGEFKGNIFYKNLIAGNTQLNIRISNPAADMTVFKENTISNCDFGILCNSGRVAMLGNLVIGHRDVGISCKGNKGIILDNTLTSNNNGLYLETCNSLIAGNTVNKGENNGITITGNKNIILRNVATKYEGTGLLLSGSLNKVCHNQLIENSIDYINNGCNNETECDCDYCYSNTCNAPQNYLQLLQIFYVPVNQLLECGCLN